MMTASGVFGLIFLLAGIHYVSKPMSKWMEEGCSYDEAEGKKTKGIIWIVCGAILLPLFALDLWLR